MLHTTVAKPSLIVSEESENLCSAYSQAQHLDCTTFPGVHHAQ